MKLEKDDLVRLFRTMLLARRVDEAMVDGLASGKIPSFWHSGQGNEATAVGGTLFLRKDDWVMGGARGHGVHQYIAKGMDFKGLLAEHCAKSTGCCGGWTGFHAADLTVGVPGGCGTVGSTFPVAVGLGLACKAKGKDNVVVAFFGDGASNRGTLHESFNLAAIWNLPIVWVCENNEYAIFMHVSEHYAGKDIADLAYGYAMPGVVVDGQDAVAVAEAVMTAVERARAGEGPSLVECKTLRLRPHLEGIGYLRGTVPVSEEELQELNRRDPINLLKTSLMDRGILTEEMVASMDKEIREEIEQAEKFVDESPIPDPKVMFASMYAD